MYIKDLTGKRFGMLTVIEDTGERKHNSVLWRCRCDCGNELQVKGFNLTKGVITNCGCVPKLRRPTDDLTGRKFGKLIVLGDSGERKDRSILWRCKCDCGGEILAIGHKLVNGTVTHCGCVPKSRRPTEDLTGRRFGKLTVVQEVRVVRGDTVWQCRCDCGGFHEVTSSNLKNGSVTSCGCVNTARKKKRAHLHFVNNTCLEQLALQTLRNTNTTGLRGVTKKRGSNKYVAQIGFRGKTYYLGIYTSTEEAYKARLEAEETLHVGCLNAYHQWQDRAGADHEWAINNPFFYEVEKVGREFCVTTNAGKPALK